MTLARRALARGALLAAALGAASAAYQQLADARDQRRYQPPGRLVDIGGRRLHLFEAGQGSPAIVIVPAVGGGVLEWLPITRRLSGLTHICVYDRPEIGWSDPPPRGKRTINAMAADLYALLTAAGIEPPYILAGHSLGGIIARRFLTRYPGTVCGLLLIDSSHEDQARRLREECWHEGTLHNLRWALRRQMRILGARRLAAALGLLRGLDSDVAGEFPPDFTDAARAYVLSTRRRRVAVRELLVLARTHGQPPDLGALPVTVLTSAETDRKWRARPVWLRLQAELAGISSGTRHIHAGTAGHYIHLDEPELVIDATRELLERCGPRTR